MILHDMENIACSEKKPHTYRRLTQTLTRVTHLPIFLPACFGLTTRANALGQIAFKNLVFQLFLRIF